MAKTRRDAWLTFLICMILGSLVIYDTLRYPTVQGQGFGLGPVFYPQVLAGVLIVLGILTLLLELLHGHIPKSKGRWRSSLFGSQQWSVFLLVFLSVAMIAAMQKVGFFISGFLLIFLSSLIIRAELNQRHVLLDLLFSAGIVLLVYTVFELFVGIELPRPTW
jgi:hypothetical protein